MAAQLQGKSLHGEEVTFTLTDIVAVYPDDGVIYVRVELGAIPVSANSVTTVHEAALKRIARLTTEWNANKLGGVSIQRKRWQRLGEIAREALET